MAKLALAFDILASSTKAEQAFKATGDAAGKAGREIEGAGEQGGKGFGSKLTGALGKAGPAIAAAGALAGAALVAGVLESFDREKASDRLAAQLNLNPAEQKQAGKVAGKVFADAYGDSLGQVNDAVRNVVQNIGVELNDVDLESITGGVLNLADVFDTDLNSVTRAAGLLLKNGLAPDAKGALDIITAGFQTGADSSGDFLDTLNEYAPQLNKLGIDGSAATGLINQGLQAGARNADIVADAFKEFSIRAIDGSELTAEAFGKLGLSADDFAQRIAAGGPTAKKATDEVVKALQAVEDPVERNIIGVGLFGTQFEDIGPQVFGALNVMNNGIVDTTGRLDRLNETVGDNASTKIESFKRKAQEVFVSFLGTSVIPKVEQFIQQFRDGEGAGGKLRDTFERVRQTLKDNEPELRQAGELILKIGEFIGTRVIPFMVELHATHIVNVVRGFNTFQDVVQGVASKALGMFSSFLGGFESVFGVLGKLPGRFGAPFREAEASVSGAKGRVDALKGSLDSAIRDRSLRVDADTGPAERAVAILVSRIGQRNAVINVTARGAEGATGRRATGGSVLGGRSYWVGEQGPELVVPPRDAYVLTAQQSNNVERSAGRPETAAGRSYHMTVVARDAVNVRDEFRRMELLAGA